MPGKDLRELAHCVSIFDLLLREITQSPGIADKVMARQSLMDGFAAMLRRDGYAVIVAQRKKMLAYAG